MTPLGVSGEPICNVAQLVLKDNVKYGGSDGATTIYTLVLQINSTCIAW